MVNTPEVIVHVPHASTVIPEWARAEFAMTDDALAGELLALTD